MSDSERLIQLFLSHHSCLTIQTAEEEEALRELGRAAIELGVEMWAWSSSTGLYEASLNQSRPLPDTAAPAAALYKLTTFQNPAILVLLDLCGHLKDDRLLRLLRDLIQQSGRNGATVVLLDAQGEVPPVVRAVATPFDLSLPDSPALEQIVKSVLRKRNEQGQFQVDLDSAGLAAIVRNLRGLSARQARQVVLDAIGRDRRFDLSDVNKVLAEKRKQFQSAGLLEYIESPVDLGEIGGLSRLKQWLKQREKSLSEAAIDFGLPPPRGVLMLGMQGAGKSLSAKAVATSWQRPLLRLDVGALYDKYIGESESRLRAALRQAEMMSPIVLWIDEIEKGFASAASQSTDGGLSKRMFGTLLTWMQEHRSPVFLIATANDIEALPPELLRKGRFDEIFFVDLPSLEGRREILSIHIAKRKRDPAQYDLDGLAESCGGFSGAEIEQAIIAGLCQAFAAGQELETSHILQSIQSSPPLSVTMAERTQALRAWAQGRCTPAD